MQSYEVKTLRAGGALSTFALEAGSASEAMLQAKAQGHTVIGVKPKSWFAWRLRRPGRASAFPVVLFSQELLSLLDAGLSLIEALETLAEKETRPDVRKALSRIIGSLYEGHTLSFALEKSEANLPQLYIESIRSGEKTGALAEVVRRYIDYQTRIDHVRNQIISSLIYPALVITVGGLVMLFLMFYVVPRFSKVYADIGTAIPLMSRLLMEWGIFISGHGWLMLCALGALAAGAAYAAMRPVARQWVVRKAWRMPAIGVRMHIYQLARFYRSLGMLLRGGMPVVPALKMTGGLLQPLLRGQLDRATDSVREGKSISQSMEAQGLTTPVALRMLRVGERTGQMGEMMERIAAFYEEETARWLERFIKVFEPLLMAFVGVVIGVIVVLMYFPIFELAGSIQ